MKINYVIIQFLIIVIIGTSAGLAAEYAPQPALSSPSGSGFSVEQERDLFRQLFENERKSLDDLRNQIEGQDIQIRNAKANAYMQYLKVQINLAEITQNMYQDQRRAAVVMLVIVVVIVFTALFFAYMQLSSGITRTIRASSAAANRQVPSVENIQAEESDAKQDPPPHQVVLNISQNGLALSTSLVGVVILVISLAFTYLYLERVFKIHPPETPRHQVDTAPKTDTKTSEAPSK